MVQTYTARTTPGVRSSVPIPMSCGSHRIGQFITFNGLDSRDEHFAVKLGPDVRCPLVRIHSECITGDVFKSQRCDCGPQLRESIEKISVHGGYLLYLRQEGRGIGLYAKLDSYVLQHQGIDTFQANVELGFEEDLRSYVPAVQMLHALNISRVKLLTNNPDKVAQLQDHGIVVDTTIRTSVFRTPQNLNYLKAKAELAKHTIKLLDEPATSEGVKL